MTSALARRLVPWGAVALVLAVTACGSSSSSVSKTTAPSVPETAAASVTTLTPIRPTSGSTAPGAAKAGGGAGRPAAGAFDFCGLITVAEAQAAVGRPVKVGISTSERTVLGPGGGCVYASINFTQKSQTLVNVGFYGNKISRSQFDKEVTSKVGAAGKPVSGLGEAAVYIAGVVAVFDHGSALQVQIVKDNVPSADLPLLTALARLALLRSSQVR